MKKNEKTMMKKQTDNRFLNMYETDFTDRTGKKCRYFFASRKEDADHIESADEKKKADAVEMIATYMGKLVLVRQKRIPVFGYIYEFPAGLMEKGEEPEEAAVREFFEETGLRFTPYEKKPLPIRPYYTSPGMSDETVSIVFGKAEGEISYDNLEPGEDIEVVLCDVKEAERLLREENVALRCAVSLLAYVRTGGKIFSEDENGN